MIGDAKESIWEHLSDEQGKWLEAHEMKSALWYQSPLIIIAHVIWKVRTIKCLSFLDKFVLRIRQCMWMMSRTMPSTRSCECARNALTLNFNRSGLKHFIASMIS